MRKKHSELVAGDVFSVMFGADGNWVTVVFDSMEVEKLCPNDKLKYCKINCHYLDGRPEVMYGRYDSYVEIVSEREVKREKCFTKRHRRTYSNIKRI